MKVINKKCDRQYFEAVLNGLKTFELRNDYEKDDLVEGDFINLIDVWDGEKTRNNIICEIIYILSYHTGLENDYAIYGIKPVMKNIVDSVGLEYLR